MGIQDYLYRETVAGASAGIIGTVLGYPLDVIKTRQQVSGLSIPRTVRAVFSESGILGFYRGMASPLLSLTVLNTLNFSTYASAKSALGIPVNIDVSSTVVNWKVAIAGGAVGPLSSLISTPFELIKTQLQLSARNSQNVTKCYHNALHASLEIAKQYGLLTLYRGYVVNTSREIVFLSTYFTVYEHIKGFQLNRRVSSSVAIPLAGGLAGSIGWLVSFPLDCLKSNIQGVNLEKHSKSKVNMIAVARELVRVKGLLGLYAGVIPSILRAFIVSSSRFSAYEATMWVISKNS